MTHLTRVFNPETRSLTSVERRYAGQVGDSLSTVLHFEYTDLQFLIQYVPYIMFDTLDDNGNPMVFGPEAPSWLEDRDKAVFDGQTFAVPWSVTSRTKSMRVNYQLFFVKPGVEFDIRNVAQLKPTEVVVSTVDGIAIKRSIGCMGDRKPCACPPYSPTGTEPDILGYIKLWKDYGIVVPATQFIDEENRVAIIRFRTYSGLNDQDLSLEGVPILVDGKLLIEQLPTGNVADTIPLLKGEIGNGKSIIYDADAGGFIEYDIAGIYQFRGTCASADLDSMAESRQTMAGNPLRNGDVYSLTDRRPYGKDELGNTQWYEAGTNWVWSEQERWEPLTGDLDLNKYQLKSFLVTVWDQPQDDQYPSAKLVKDSLDAKLDDSQVLDSWADLDESKSGQTIQIPSARLSKHTLDDKLDDSQVITSWDDLDRSKVGQVVQLPSAVLAKDSLDRKTDLNMAVPHWSAEEVYSMGSTVIYNQFLYISQVEDNVGNVPISEEGDVSDFWAMVQGDGGGSSSSEYQKWIIGNGKSTSFNLNHRFGAKDLFIALRERATGEYKSAKYTATRPGILNVVFTDPPDSNQYVLTISPAVQAQPSPEMIQAFDFTSEVDTWVIDHNLGRIVNVQTFDASGYEIHGEVKFETKKLDQVTIYFNHPHKGTAVIR